MATRKSTKEKATAKKETKALDLKSNALVKVDKETQLAYIDIPFVSRPVGGEYDDEDDIRIRIPKMKLLHNQCRELKKGTRVEGADEGMYYNMLTGELYDSLEIVALFKFRERYYNVPQGSSNMICTSRDGKGKVGICLSGDYDKNKIPTAFVKDEGIDIQVGLCKKCPHSKRAYGEQSDCQLVEHLVCVHRKFLSEADSFLNLIENGDSNLAGKILQNTFTLPFKSTSLPRLDIILQTAYVTGKYFGQSWHFEAEEKEQDQYQWQLYTITPGLALNNNELIVAYSLMLFTQKLRKVIKITDIEEIPNGQPSGISEETPVDLT